MEELIMTEKEKAKAYDEAIERAKKIYGNEIIEVIFPELKEEDAERIKKNCIHFLELQKQHHTATFEIEECIAWLEKQGKQVSSQINERAWLYLVADVLTWKDGIGQYLDDPRVQELAKRLCSEYAQKLYNHSNTGKIEPKFKVGDWIITPTNKVLQITSIEGTSYRFNNESHYLEICYCDEQCRFWTIEDANDGDVLACKEEILLFKSYSVQERISLSCWYNGHTNNFHSKEEIDISLNKRHKIFPTTKEQRDTFMKAMNDAGYEWDAEKKELKKKS